MRAVDLRAGERAIRRRGFARIAGTDEAGAGPLAGPLVAAAVILKPRCRLPEVDDSKKLRPDQRERLFDVIRARALAYAIVEVSAARVDAIGPYRGSVEAMRRAVLTLDPAPDYVLVDARPLGELPMPHASPIRGDGQHLVIAAASILAKVHRDRLMRALDARYPGYGFATHKGYGTAAHLEALRARGPCPEHRASYAPVRALTQRALFEDPGGGAVTRDADQR